MESTYLTNCIYIQECDGDEAARDDLKQKFTSTTKDLSDGFSASLAAHFTFSRTTKKARMSDDWDGPDKNSVALYQAIPSALALYRLCAFDAGTVRAYGPDGYKCVWSMSFIHAATGELVVFGEHKGAFSFWTRFSGKKDAPHALCEDLLALLTYLVSDNFAHPYDGLVAGGVA